MQTTNIYMIVAAPVFILIFAEIIYCVVKKNGFYSYQDSLMGLGTMAMAQCVNVALIAPILISYTWIYDNFRIFTFENTWWTFVLCYIGSDFLFYWFHRAGHRVNIFWAAHVPHHSAEELNYAVALRASLTQRAASFLFYWPLCILGFTPNTAISIVAINLVYQLIPHTRVIKKYPKWIEAWLNSPYHHQVHHAANPIYWDKNYGGTFIIWDKMFGTYQPQVEPIYYGISVPPKSWNPFYINFQWFMMIFKDFFTTKIWSDRFKLLFKPPSFRPRDLPQHKELPLMGYIPPEKYTSTPFKHSVPYLCVQLVLAFYTLFPVMSLASPLNGWEKTLLSALIFFHIYNLSLFLEAKPLAKVFETIRIFLLCAFIFQAPLETGYPLMKYIIYGTSVISLIYLFFRIDSTQVEAAPSKQHIVTPINA
jgi:alkylglycerol monooxygenase